MKKIILLFLIFIFTTSGFSMPSPCRERFPEDVSYIRSDKCDNDKPFLKITFEEDCGRIVNKKETAECIGCDHLDGIQLFEGHEHDFDICLNRKTIKDDTYSGLLRKVSILKQCPEGMIMTSYGNYKCVPCTIKRCNLETNECAKCPNRERIFRGGVRYDCRIKCPENTFNAYDECISCDSPEAIEVLYTEDCSCPNRVIESTHRCVLRDNTFEKESK